MRLNIILFAMMLIKFGKSAEPIDDEPFRHCWFCIEWQTPEGPDYEGPGPDQDEVSNLQKNCNLFFPNFFQKSLKIISTFFR